ncbi:peptidoglycan-binding protein [Bradyrhizobium lablabi]|uniref:peptidoglycan-binding protein n=1 Tax=Bradyrhizobium lablabi TaxID=722472 RepID=UPI0020133489|nr:peptidoglycan-binding protein [Bradyrhizobium lablabi]
MPRRRRGAKAVAIDAEEERGLVMRLLLHSPKDMLAGILAAAVIVAILINALFLQAGHHPSPMFGGSVVTLQPPAPIAAVAGPLPRPRPVEAITRVAEPAPVEHPKPVEVKSAEAKPAEAKPVEARPSDPMTNLVVKSTGAVPAASAAVVRPPAPIPWSNQTAAGKRIAAVQRALTEYGYGQLKPTGLIGADTQTAIAKFERDRKLPVTGQMSDRMVRELAAMIGHPIE